jgi:murein DD-endopeptidase MepM/ murein hydrolase activator NlpD
MRLRLGATLSVLGAALVLSACGSWSLRAPAPGGQVASPPFTLPAQPVYARPEPPRPTIVVGPGDTLDSIARRQGVSFDALAQINNVPPPYRLRVGQYLLLPARGPAVAQQPQPAFNASERIILRPPGMSARVEPLNTAPIVASPAPPGAAASRSSAIQSEALAPLGGGTPVAPPPAPSRVAAAPPPPPPETVTVDEAAIGRIPARAARNFAWPLRGTIASDYGSKPGGLANDGINISAAPGTPVRAAENGVVSYAGNELRGFGNLVLIRHADNWVTAYAHLDSIDVRTGAEVQRGQTIGRVGQTGNVAEPQLHFEIRRAGTPVNPRQYMPAQTAER